MAETALTPAQNISLRRIVKYCLLFTLAWHLLAAWFSIGYHQFDEHFQIVEFAAYKMGITTLDALPWEFGAQIRPALQPAAVVGLLKLLPAASPGTIEFILRLFASLLGFGVLVFVLHICLPMVQGYQPKLFLVAASTLFWFIPYLHAHFSSESISGSLYFLALGCIYVAHQKNRGWLYLLGGFLAGLSFVCRFQTGFMLLGLAFWCLFVAKVKFKNLVLMSLAALAALGIGVWLDKWYYGHWVFTAFNYFRSNIVEGKAASFGTSPWYSYFLWLFLDFLPPFGILILAGLLYSLGKYRSNIFSLTVIPFLLAHIVVAHKEPRFLFPAAFALPVLLALAAQDVWGRWPEIFAKAKVWARVFWGCNIALMAVICLKPASDQAGLQEYLYEHYNSQNTVLASHDEDPYNFGHMHFRFNMPKGIHIYPYLSDKGIDSLKDNMKPSRPSSFMVLFAKDADCTQFLQSHPNAKVLYSSYPDWIKKFNFFHWLDRTRTWKLLELPLTGP